MPKVMLVDDDRTTVTLLHTLLSLDGFDVVAVPRGSEVLQQAHREKPDAFIIDFHLSDMDGTVLVSSLRKDPQFAGAPIIMASGMNVETEAKKAGADLFLTKPYEPGGLAILLTEMLGKRQGKDQGKS